MITLITLGILIVLILIFILVSVTNASTKLSIFQQTKFNNIEINDTPEFKAGCNHAFTLVQICLYKMWSENNILDFENINQSIKDNLINITKSQDDFNQWNKKFIEYINSKKEGEKNDF